MLNQSFFSLLCKNWGYKYIEQFNYEHKINEIFNEIIKYTNLVHEGSISSVLIKK